MAEHLPSVEPRGPISKAVRALVDLVAESESFQEWVGAASPAEAVAHCDFPHCAASNDPNLADLPAEKRPLAIVMTKEFALERTTAYGMQPRSPQLTLIFTAFTEYPDRTDWGQTAFENWVGLVLTDIATLQGQDERLSIKSIEPVGPAEYHDNNREKGVWFAEYTITWAVF